MKPAHFDSVCADLDHRRGQVLTELHPRLSVLVRQIETMTGGRLTPYCGYRGPIEQAQARALGNSNAAFGESPHNYHPALACDLVLDPRAVSVREAPDVHFPGYPDLWDDVSPEAIGAWRLLDEAAGQLGLERVTFAEHGHAVCDLPHVQLPGWRVLAGVMR